MNLIHLLSRETARTGNYPQKSLWKFIKYCALVGKLKRLLNTRSAHSIKIETATLILRYEPYVA